MKSVSSAVQSIISQDEIALEAIRAGILNMSAYAEKIQQTVDEITWKSVKKGTIVVALSRIALELSKSASLRPFVQIDDISIRSPLCDVSFDKSKPNQEATKTLLQSRMYQQPNSFFTVTEGVSEITIIAPDRYYDTILGMYSTGPKATYRGLTGISIRFSESYLDIPNVIYVLVGQLALKQINVLEIVSTYTELAVIVEEKDSELALMALRQYMSKSTQR